MPITVLSDETVKLIKSTQVVSNVWSVVKELVENSLDANANNVEVYLIENGLSLIKVNDNGCGIFKEDAPYMGLSSYTSKMTNFKDLESLTSYGFRGVALNSMCALADVSVTTKTDTDQVATIYNLNQNGEIVQTGQVHGNRGTTVQVKDLCKRFPVRRKILSESRCVKKDVKNVEMLIKDFSICNPDVRFVLQINGKVIFSKPIVKDLKEALTHVVGRANVLNLHWINHSIAEVEIDLLVPTKDAKNLSDIFKSGQSYVFINKRPVKQKDIEQVILKKIIEYFSSEHPNVRKSLFVVNMNVDPAKVDVNLEPNKDQVFLHDKDKIVIIMDEILSGYYGLQVMERSDSNKENTLIQNSMSDDTFDPDRSLINDSAETEKEPRKRCYGEESRKFEHTIYPPVLSEPDSDEDGGMPRKKSRSPCVETILEKSKLSVNKKKDQQGLTLSQLPVVNLGEDFDLLDPNKNVGTDCTSVQESCAEKVEKKDEKTDVAVEIGSDAWSRGQIIGGGGVHLLRMNYVDLDCKNTTIETKHSRNLNSGFGIFFSEARSQIMRQHPNAKEAEVAKQISTRWHKELSSEERGYYRDQALLQQEALTPRSQKRRLADADMDESGRKIIKYLQNEKQENKEKQPVRLKKTILPWNITLQDVKANFKKTLTSTTKQNHSSTTITIIGQAPESDNFWFVKYDNSLWMINVSALLKESDGHENTLPCQVNATMLKQLLDTKFCNNSEIDQTIMHHIHDF